MLRRKKPDSQKKAAVLERLLGAHSNLVTFCEIEKLGRSAADTIERVPGVKSLALWVRGAKEAFGEMEVECCERCSDLADVHDSAVPSECCLEDRGATFSRKLAFRSIPLGYLFIELNDESAFEEYETIVSGFVDSLAFAVQHLQTATRADSSTGTGPKKPDAEIPQKEELTELQARLDKIFETTQMINRSRSVAIVWKRHEDSVATHSPDLNETYSTEFVSENVEKLCGYSAGEFLSGEQNWEKLIHPDDFGRINNEFESFSSDDSRQEFTHSSYRIVTKSGEAKWIDDTTHIRKNSDGAVTHLEGFLTDSTKKHEKDVALSKSEARYRALFENAPVCIHEIDLDGRLVSMNAAGLKMLGLKSQEEVVGGEYLSAVAASDQERVRRLMNLALTGRGSEFQFTGTRQPDIQIFWSGFIPIMNESGKVTKLMGVTADITEQQLDKKKLEKSERLLLQTGEIAKIGGWEFSIESNRLAWNDQTKLIHGVPRDYVPEVETAIDFYHPDDRSTIQDAVENAINNGTPYDLELRIITTSNDVLWIQTIGKAVREKGKITKIAGTFQDITERHEAALALTRYEEIISSTSDMLAILSKEYIYLAVNDSYADVFNLETSDMVGQSVTQFHDERLFEESIKPQAEKCFKGQSVRWQSWFEFPATGKQYMDVAYTPHYEGKDQLAGFVVSARNITELELTQVELERMVLEGTMRIKELQCIYRVAEAIRTQTSIEEILQKVATLIPSGWHYPEIAGCRIHFDGAEYASKTFKDTAWHESQDLVVDGLKRGSIVIFHIDEKDDSTYGSFQKEERELLEGIAKNLAEAVVSRQAARERDRLVAAIEQSSEIIVIADKNIEIEYVNASFERVTGYSREEAIGRNPGFLKAGTAEKTFYEELWRTLLAGKSWTGTFVNRKKNGSLYTEEAVITPILDANGETTNYIASKRDITDEIKLEEQLRQSQKMESIGQLAGGVAHDFNNMLGVIVGHSEMVLDQLKVGEPHFNSLTEILSAAQRSSNLTRQLLAFARKQTIAPVKLDLNETVEGMLKMLRRLIGENIKLGWNPAPTSQWILMDPSQLDQILANLMVNARDAIEGGAGRISIETGSLTLGTKDIHVHAQVVEGRYVYLEVRDSGCGMDEQIMERIYDPFFTTKQIGQSTGLGLATVFGIIKQNNGYITVDSQVGAGTCFTIYLPWSSPATAQPNSGEENIEFFTGSETILLVEDELSLLKMTAMVLERQGYTVIGADSPLEAIELMKSRSSEVNLLLTDVIMPQMNGGDLATELTAINPDLKCMFMSGYTADMISKQGVLKQGIHFVKKPFLALNLARKVRRALDS